MWQKWGGEVIYFEIIQTVLLLVIAGSALRLSLSNKRHEHVYVPPSDENDKLEALETVNVVNRYNQQGYVVPLFVKIV